MVSQVDLTVGKHLKVQWNYTHQPSWNEPDEPFLYFLPLDACTAYNVHIAEVVVMALMDITLMIVLSW